MTSTSFYARQQQSPLQYTPQKINKEPMTYLVGAGKLGLKEKQRIEEKCGEKGFGWIEYGSSNIGIFSARIDAAR